MEDVRKREIEKPHYHFEKSLKFDFRSDSGSTNSDSDNAEGMLNEDLDKLLK